MKSRKFLGFLFIVFLIAEINTYSFDFFATFKEAKKGDYIILTINKTYTCLSIFERNENRLVLEEITYLQSKLHPKDAKELFETTKSKASHTLLEIDLESKLCITCFDVMNHTFLDPTTIDPFLLKLFQLDFQLMRKDDRRKVGVLDLAATFDNRPLWNPSYSFCGSTVKGHTCDGYRAVIPKDVKLVGGKYIEIYLDPQLKNFCFPVWFQLSDDAQSFKMIPVDMGTQFKSKITTMPRPLPQFVSALKIDEHKISFEIDTTYPINSHRFYYYERATLDVIQAKILKKERMKSNRFLIEIEKPKKQDSEYGLYTTSDQDKDLLVECLHTYKEKK